MKDRIKELRKKLGLTQQEFANKLGIPRGNIASYETGKNIPSDIAVSLICKEYDVSEEWLRDGTGEMFKKRLPVDETAAFVGDLLDYDGDPDNKNPFYDIIIEMMRTYSELDEPSKQAMLSYFRLLKENLAKKKEG